VPAGAQVVLGSTGAALTPDANGGYVLPLPSQDIPPGKSEVVPVEINFQNTVGINLARAILTNTQNSVPIGSCAVLTADNCGQLRPAIMADEGDVQFAFTAMLYSFLTAVGVCISVPVPILCGPATIALGAAETLYRGDVALLRQDWQNLSDCLVRHGNLPLSALPDFIIPGLLSGIPPTLPQFPKVPPPTPTDSSSSTVCVVFASDPNDKVGPSGYGQARYVPGSASLPYSVDFENVATATAPAQKVVVTDQLDPAKVDLSTFSLGAI